MRRRTKRGPNNSESTGRIGQEIPANQPAPLRPSYGSDDPPVSKPAAETPKTVEPKPGRGPGGRSARERTSAVASANQGVFAEPIGEFQDGILDDDIEPAIPETQPTVAAEGKLVIETQPESPSQAPPEAQAVKALRGYVVLTIGLPGSGKTTWFKRRGVTPLSSDMLRNILFDDITEQRYQGLVFSTLRSLLRARLIAKMPWNYVDATNLSPHERRQWIKMAKSFGYEVQAVFFDVPFEVCMERNQRRERTVSDETMHKMAERLRPPNFKEGFSKITVVRVKGSAGSGEIAPEPAAGEPAPAE